MITFQDIIASLQLYWMKKGCLLQQSYEQDVGAGTFHPDTFFRALTSEPYNVVHAQACIRPADGRYGENPNRLQRFHQMQVIMKPSPSNFQELYLESLEAMGLKLNEHDIRFVHDDWAAPTQGAWGCGWEVWCDGMEVTQFTYFQSVAGQTLSPITVELAYGIERLAMFLQGVKNVYDVMYNERLSYGDVYKQNEKEWSVYNFEKADVEMYTKQLDTYEKEGIALAEQGLSFPAYHFVLKMSHAFNVLDARGAISTSERVQIIHRVRDLACFVAKVYVQSREELGYPLCRFMPVQDKKTLTKKDLTTYDPTKTSDFLFEILSEELPATYVPIGIDQLEKAVSDLLKSNGLHFSKIETFATARRLAILVKGLPQGLADKTIQKRGPSIKVAFDEKGNLTKQGAGFFKSTGLKPLTLDELKSGKEHGVSLQNGEYLSVEIIEKGKSTFAILQEGLSKVFDKFSFPRSMRWGTFETQYARPIRSILALLDTEVVPVQIADIISSNTTYGHAQRGNKQIEILEPKTYVEVLKKHHVLVDKEKRKISIIEQLETIEKKLSLKAQKRSRLIEEILYLSEWPLLASYQFDEKFLSLPDELLISEMTEHQRYFSLADKNGKITNHFVITVDKEPTELILQNNLNVLLARLNDGLFLYEQDLKYSLKHYNEMLKKVVFHQKLGTIAQKVERLENHSAFLAPLFGCEDLSYLSRAAKLSKADLATQVVDEFPDLQGTIGKYYALKSGEPPSVATAIEEHWWPLGEGSKLPSTLIGSILAAADRLDNLVGYFSVDLRPSSSKDPYALRRQAISLIRILIEGSHSLDLRSVVSAISEGFLEKFVHEDLLEFFKGRLKGVLLDYGYKKEEVAAVLEKSYHNPYDAFCRTESLHKFRKESDAFETMYEVYKRARGQIGEREKETLSRNLLKEPSEIALIRQLDTISTPSTKALEEKRYIDALEYLATLQNPLSDLFDQVRILDDDVQIQKNRIALLQCVFDKFSKLLDFQGLGSL